VDGEQIDIPAAMPTSASGTNTRSVSGVGSLININTATLAELDTLPDIGPKTGQRIIDYREANGPFNQVEDLLKVDGIGEVTFNKIKSLITVETSP
jgi:comEA protein